MSLIFQKLCCLNATLWPYLFLGKNIFIKPFNCKIIWLMTANYRLLSNLKKLWNYIDAQSLLLSEISFSWHVLCIIYFMFNRNDKCKNYHFYESFTLSRNMKKYTCDKAWLVPSCAPGRSQKRRLSDTIHRKSNSIKFLTITISNMMVLTILFGGNKCLWVIFPDYSSCKINCTESFHFCTSKVFWIRLCL